MLLRGLVGVLTALGLLIPQGTAQAAPYLEPDPGKIGAAVLTDLEQDGKATFWVRLKGEADLSAARRTATREAKAKAVYTAKTTHAERSQAGLRTLLSAKRADFTPFWIVNAVKVTGDAKLAAEIAKLPEVDRIEPDRTVTMPVPEPADPVAKVNAVEWNIDRVGAPRVWDELGVRGEGIVVAHIDSGAQFDHPAIVSQYRGRTANDAFDHNYNWFDPAGVCPSPAPCDNNGHGTHVMGTIAGQGGIGVAPGVTWIAAKGCESSSCSRRSLLAAGQWVLAPTDLNGENPRPELAPHIVNNSWGVFGFDPWYKPVVTAWVEAGIFPMFANGNEGPACSTSGSPGQYVESYSTGGFDVNNVVYQNSSRGGGENGEIKPNLSAPAVSVRSSMPGNGYDTLTGTSMASPHVAATVALIWSAAPALQGDIDATRALLDGSAIDVDDNSCGGAAADNNVWGEGRLDTFAAVQAAPDEPLGELRGTVTADGEPVSGATVTVTGPVNRSMVTGEDGTFGMVRLLPGDYEITVSYFGYEPASPVTVTVAGDQTVTADLTMERLPTGMVSGTVTMAGQPEAGATVAATGTAVTAVTDADGRYEMTLPNDSYELAITPGPGCAAATTAQVTVDGDVTRDVELPLRADDWGYTCQSGALPYVAGTERLPLTGDDTALQVDMPFQPPLYWESLSQIWVSSNGFASYRSFIPSTSAENVALPTFGIPNLAVYPYWDDLVIDEEAGVYTAVTGAAPHRNFVIEWRNVALSEDRDLRLSFSVLLGEDGTISYRYKDIESEHEQGTSATIGIESEIGFDGLMYSHNAAAVTGGQSLSFVVGRHGVLTGVVSDANGGDPLADATVRISDLACTASKRSHDGSDLRFDGILFRVKMQPC
jgi:subtilisin family serine protease